MQCSPQTGLAQSVWSRKRNITIAEICLVTRIGSYALIQWLDPNNKGSIHDPLYDPKRSHFLKNHLIHEVKEVINHYIKLSNHYRKKINHYSKKGNRCRKWMLSAVVSEKGAFVHKPHKLIMLLKIIDNSLMGGEYYTQFINKVGVEASQQPSVIVHNLSPGKQIQWIMEFSTSFFRSLSL